MRGDLPESLRQSPLRLREHLPLCALVQQQAGGGRDLLLGGCQLPHELSESPPFDSGPPGEWYRVGHRVRPRSQQGTWGNEPQRKLATKLTHAFHADWDRSTRHSPCSYHLKSQRCTWLLGSAVSAAFDVLVLRAARAEIGV